MFHMLLLQRLGRWLAVVALLGFGLAFAQAEPTLSQVYEAAQSGKLDQAQLMMQQVLIAHPNSAKAHFVQAELFARQGKTGRASEALASAEKLAPGLPFAKPDAVQGLRTQIAASLSSTAPKQQSGSAMTNARPAASAAPTAAPASTTSWALPLLLAGGVMAAGFFFFRRKPPTTFNAPAPSNSPYAGPAASPAYNGANPSMIGANLAPAAGGLSGPQSFGAAAPANGQPAYGQPAYGQPAPAAGGMGGKLMGGLATGLAVGAGVMAAQAIAKSFSGEHDNSAKAADNHAGSNQFEPVANNYDMGGQGFGLNDTSAWDDGNAVADSGGGGGDWDS